MSADVVVKIGGGMLSDAAAFANALRAVAGAARGARVLVVPGGGPFADAVRDVDRRFSLSADTAHWMAILAMDQYAWMLASRLPSAVVVGTPDDIAYAFAGHRIPVLAPSRWLQSADPLPHSWDVTSDSIAAWIAGAVGAARLVLVKPPGANDGAVDGHFSVVVPSGVAVAIVNADQLTAAQLVI